MRHTKTLRARLLKGAARVFTIAALLGAQGLSAQSIWEGGDLSLQVCEDKFLSQQKWGIR